MRHTVIITGATKGLGRALAVAFASKGHRILGLYASDDAAASSTRAELQTLGADFLVLKADVRDENPELWTRPEIQNAASLVLINNACMSFAPQPFHLLSWDDWAGALDVSLKGSWQCVQGLLRPMIRAGRGVIVNVLTSAMHQQPPPKGFAAYLAAKHAQRGLTLSLASEYGGKGLRIFSVSPSFMQTSLTAQWDARLVEAICSAAPASDPASAALRIYELVEGAANSTAGEDYSV